MTEKTFCWGRIKTKLEGPWGTICSDWKKFTFPCANDSA